MGIMSLTSSRRGNALLLVVAVSLLSVLCAVPSVQATPRTIEPAAAITVTLVLNQAAYLSGDVAIATALVYRTPGPANYTYNWTVRDTFGRIVNTTIYGESKFTYAIPLNYTARLTFSATVDDGHGLTSSVQSTVTAFVAVMSLRLDAGRFDPRAPRGDASEHRGLAASVHLDPKPGRIRRFAERLGDHDRPRGGPHPAHPPGSGNRRARRDRDRVEHGHRDRAHPAHRDDERPVVDGHRGRPPVCGPPGPPVHPLVRGRPRALAPGGRRPSHGTEGRTAASASRRYDPGTDHDADVRDLQSLREVDRPHDEQAADRGHVPFVRRDADRGVTRTRFLVVGPHPTASSRRDDGGTGRTHCGSREGRHGAGARDPRPRSASPADAHAERDACPHSGVPWGEQGARAPPRTDTRRRAEPPRGRGDRERATSQDDPGAVPDARERRERGGLHAPRPGRVLRSSRRRQGPPRTRRGREFQGIEPLREHRARRRGRRGPSGSRESVARRPRQSERPEQGELHPAPQGGRARKSGHRPNAA